MAPSMNGIDQPASKIGEKALLGAVWALAGVAFAFLVARGVVRIRAFGRFFADDVFVLIAFLILLANAAVTTAMIPSMYELLRVSIGIEKATPQFLDRASFYLKCQFTSTLLFWSCLWSVKACFLAFFRRLTVNLKGPRRAWWCITAFTALAYVSCIATYPASCTSFVLGECTAAINVERSLISLRYSTAVDVLSDIFIIALPLFIIFRVQISFAQKLALFSVISLGVVIIAFSIVRIVVTNRFDVHPEVTWLALWSSIESSVAVIVAGLASFRVLFIDTDSIEKSKSIFGTWFTRRPGKKEQRNDSRDEEKDSAIEDRHTRESLDDLDQLGFLFERVNGVSAQRAPAPGA